MELVDREVQLDQLIASLDAARDGDGGSVLVRGEAGCGKTSLVRAALAVVDDRLRVGWTSCEPLRAPRPLAPINEAGRQLAGVHADVDVDVLFGALRDEATVLVIEDLHWADDATLDVVTGLAGRMSATPSTLVVTYRPSGAAPLRRVLGQFARFGARYVDTPPLSRESVAALASAVDRDGDRVFDLSGGVAFLVAAVLGAPGEVLPDSAVDAILALASRLDDASREALETIACVPRAGSAMSGADALVPLAVLERAGVGIEAIDGAERTGLIDIEPAGAAFRHELGRLAVESTLSATRQRLIHRRLRDAFRTIGADPAVIAHHAIGAGDDTEIIEFCTEAADASIAVGAHRQACFLLSHAVDAARRAKDDRLIDLAERSARQRYLTNDLVGAIEHQRVALGKLLGGSDADHIATAHLRLSRYSWFRGDALNASAHVETVLSVLADQPVGELRAEALAARCRLSMLRGDRAGAERDAAAALAALGDADRPDLRAALDNDIGSVRLLFGELDGLAQLQTAIDRANGRAGEEYVRGCTNAAYALTEIRQLSAAEPYLAQAMMYAHAHELDTWSTYMVGVRARWRLLRGNTTAALEDAESLDETDSNDLNRVLPGLVRGTIAARSADSSADDLLAEALEIAHHFDEAHRVGPVLAAIAESAWLRDVDDPVDQLVSFLVTSGKSVGPMLCDEIESWLVRLGGPPIGALEAPATFQRSPAVDAESRAAQWEDLHAPYDQALALIDDGRPESLLRARRICEPLGASATVHRIDRFLQQAHVPVPRWATPQHTRQPGTAHVAPVRSARPHHPGPDEPGNRGPTVHQPEDRRAPCVSDPDQARREEPHRSGGYRSTARARSYRERLS